MVSASALARRAWAARHSSGFWSGFWCTGDQALTSGVNFMTLLLLGRSLSANDFGVFGVCYTLLILGTNLQNVLITLPHNVLAAAMDDDEYRTYTAQAATAQTGVAAAVGGVALSAAGVAFLIGAPFAPLLVAFAAATFAWQLQEFVRQIQYTRSHANRALVIDLISYGGQVLILAALWRLDWLSVEATLYVIAATSLVSFLYAVIWPGLRFARVPAAFVRRNWRFGRWLMGDNLGTWFSSGGYTFLAVIILGAPALAAVRAAQNLIAPAHVLIRTFQAYAVPRATRAFERGGRSKLFAFLLPLSVVIVVPLAVYFLAVCLLGRYLLELLYAGKYGDSVDLLWLFSACYLVQHAAQTAWIGLVVQGNTRAVFAGRAASILFTVTVGVWLVWRFGTDGVVAGILLSVVVLAAVLVHQLARSASTRTPRTVESPAALAAAGGEL